MSNTGAGAGDDLTTTVTSVPGGRIMRVRGRIDCRSSTRFLELLKQEAAAASATGGLIVDLSGVGVITSPGLRALLRVKTHLHTRGSMMVVACSDPTVIEVIRITRIDDLITVVETPEEATALLAANAATGRGTP